MSFARTLAMSLNGLEGTLVEVETDLSRGLPAFSIVGLPDSSTLQSRERVRSACAQLGYVISDKKLTVNLSPAWIPKRGSGFDLAIAIGVLTSLGVLKREALRNIMFLGELTLDAHVRAVPGILPALMAAVQYGLNQVFVPAANEAEAALVPGLRITAVHTLDEAIAALGGRVRTARPPEHAPHTAIPVAGEHRDEPLDFSDVHGQDEAKQSAEIAAAGGHHLLLMGPPGAGKTMIASRIPSILPPLHDQAALELSAIASLRGTFDASTGLLRKSPFIAPHHTATVAAIIGGGAGIAGPGAVSQAHGGVLFLDEAPEFSPRVLEALREVLESGEVELRRSRGVTRYPARFQLVVAANPCPCGRAGSNAGCECTSLQQRRYRLRLSGPIIDRIDLRITVPPAHISRLGQRSEASSAILERVLQARERQAYRLRNTPWALNAHVNARYLDERMRLGAREETMLLRSVERGVLTMRGRDRVRRLAWSIADLSGAASPSPDHFSHALALRGEGW